MTTLERYRLLSRRPALRLELRRGRATLLFLGLAVVCWLAVWLAAGLRSYLFAVTSVGLLAGLATLLVRERWTIGAQGVRFERAPWQPAVERPREAFERVSLRCVVANGDPVVLPWQVALEDGDGGGLFVFGFQGELPARIVGRLVVEALELELVDGGDIDPQVAAAVREALARL